MATLPTILLPRRPPGDTVIVRKAGDVIPEVVGPVLSMRKAQAVGVPEGRRAAAVRWYGRRGEADRAASSRCARSSATNG